VSLSIGDGVGASNGYRCGEIKVQVCNLISCTCSTPPLTNNTCLQNDSWCPTKIHMPLL
jgi:hypothetical protein